MGLTGLVPRWCWIVQKKGKGNVVLLAGGVGGSKMAEGFAGVCGPDRLTVIGNVGDDLERHGLWISPDMDILTYSLAGLVDRKKGWGFAEESFRVLQALERLGEKTWFRLGDLDLATHIYRTDLRKKGIRPTEIAEKIAKHLGVSTPILPPTDDPLQTEILTDEGWLGFQEYFVRERCSPEVRDVRYKAADSARPTDEVLDSIQNARLVVIAPSNPIASIGPILAIDGIKEALESSSARRLAVSPIVGGRSLKGPSGKMLEMRNLEVSPLGVARHYGTIVDSIVIDTQDSELSESIRREGWVVLVTDTIMSDLDDKCRLAREILEFIEND